VTGKLVLSSQSATLRLLVIPGAIYTAWLIEIFLLEGSVQTFEHFDPLGILLYTIIACIFTGIVAPLLWIRNTFISGAVNMFQIGFRSLRRTSLACILTCGIGYGTVILFNPFGSDRFAFANAFLLLLPTAIASVMICLVLAGTHVQAFVRDGGVIISISVGIAITAFLFGLTTVVLFPGVLGQDILLFSVITGIIASFFFFAVREVYSTIILVTVCSVFTLADMLNPFYVQNAVPVVQLSAILQRSTAGSNPRISSRNYMTLKILKVTEDDTKIFIPDSFWILAGIRRIDFFF
jgi:hypothetical protein